MLDSVPLSRALLCLDAATTAESQRLMADTDDASNNQQLSHLEDQGTHPAPGAAWVRDEEPIQLISKGNDALSSQPEVNIWSLRQSGYLLQYFSVGLIYGGLPATAYGFFLGYLAVPAHVYATVRVILVMPWSFKFAFGLLNDTVPICGYRRKPYMVFGWACCALMLLVLALTPLPAPYWCHDTPTGEANTTAPPCNPEAKKKGGGFAFMMMLAALGYVVADVAADGLTVEFARAEPIARRGRVQTTAYMTRTLGVIVATLLVGFGMNGREYNGTFDGGMSFNAICGTLAVPATLMVPASWYLIHERKQTAALSVCAYLRMTWELLRSKAMFHVVLYQFLAAAILAIQTPAIGEVKQYWAGVKNLQANVFQLLGNALFVVGLWGVKRHGLTLNWRVLLFGSQALLQLLDMPFQLCTIFDVVRNQYFYRAWNGDHKPAPCPVLLCSSADRCACSNHPHHISQLARPFSQRSLMVSILSSGRM